MSRGISLVARAPSKGSWEDILKSLTAAGSRNHPALGHLNSHDELYTSEDGFKAIFEIWKANDYILVHETWLVYDLKRGRYLLGDRGKWSLFLHQERRWVPTMHTSYLSAAKPLRLSTPDNHRPLKKLPPYFLDYDDVRCYDSTFAVNAAFKRMCSTILKRVLPLIMEKMEHLTEVIGSKETDCMNYVANIYMTEHGFIFSKEQLDVVKHEFAILTALQVVLLIFCRELKALPRKYNPFWGYPDESFLLYITFLFVKELAKEVKNNFGIRAVPNFEACARESVLFYSQMFEELPKPTRMYALANKDFLRLIYRRDKSSGRNCGELELLELLKVIPDTNKMSAFMASSSAMNNLQRRLVDYELDSILQKIRNLTMAKAEPGQGNDSQAITADKNQKGETQTSVETIQPINWLRAAPKDMLNYKNRLFYLTPSRLVPGPTLLDRIKGTVEILVNQPILWWPLKAKKIACPEGYMRISWNCECGNTLSFDAQSDAAMTFAQQYSPTPSTSPLLPTHNRQVNMPSSQANIGREGSTPLMHLSIGSSRSGATTIVGENAQQRIISETTSNRFLHWCVDSASADTLLFSLRLPRLNDILIVQKLKDTYKASKGIRQWVSLTDCHGVKFVMFKRGAQGDSSKDLIVCVKEDLPPLTDPNYSYQDLEPPGFAKRFAAETLKHHLHYPHKCSPKDIEDIMTLVPKKVNGILEKKFGITGWGIQAVHGLSFWKCCVALAIAQIPSTIFAIKWLLGHPGDLQNAFLLSLYSVAMLNILIVLPERWTTQKAKYD